MFARRLGLPTVLVGVGLPDDRIHAPNEKMDVEQYHAGMRVLTRLWDALAVMPPGRAVAR
jgi:acetylornithine deacetylase/succinyl-diaminopimelate desuccinylase-like protein